MRKGVLVLFVIVVVVVGMSGAVSAYCYEIRDANGVDTHFQGRVKFLEAAKEAPFGCECEWKEFWEVEGFNL